MSGWIIKYGSMTAVEKALDSDPCVNHEFLQQRGKLVDQNPDLPKSLNEGIYLNSFSGSYYDLRYIPSLRDLEGGDQKSANPGMRLGKNNVLNNPKQVVVSEEPKQGLQAPKKQFMVLSAYEKCYGTPDPAQIKTMIMKIRGQDVRSVDLIGEFQQGIYTY